MSWSYQIENKHPVLLPNLIISTKKMRKKCMNKKTLKSSVFKNLPLSKTRMYSTKTKNLMSQIQAKC